MIPRVLLLVVLCVSLESAEQIFYRMAAQTHQRRSRYWTRVTPAIFIHIVRLALWYLLLKMVPLGLAVPLLGLNYLAIALVGRFFFGERVDGRRWLGTALVMAGFVLVAARLES